jgi:hypothetical protein
VRRAKFNAWLHKELAAGSAKGVVQKYLALEVFKVLRHNLVV